MSIFGPKIDAALAAQQQKTVDEAQRKAEVEEFRKAQDFRNRTRVNAADAGLSFSEWDAMKRQRDLEGTGGTPAIPEAPGQLVPRTGALLPRVVSPLMVPQRTVAPGGSQVQQANWNRAAGKMDAIAADLYRRGLYNAGSGAIGPMGAMARPEVSSNPVGSSMKTGRRGMAG